mgnify:CR=1 FL=1
MVKKTQNQPGYVTFTDSQFEDLKKILQSYLKVTAIGAVRELTEKEIERNTWLLNAAGFSQREIGKILHTSKSKINRILAGKPAKRKGEKEAEK